MKKAALFHSLLPRSLLSTERCKQALKGKGGFAEREPRKRRRRRRRVAGDKTATQQQPAAEEGASSACTQEKAAGRERQSELGITRRGVRGA